MSGSGIGPVTDEPPSGELGVPGGGGEDPEPGGGTVVVVLGARIMKHAGPALRWLAWAAVGLRGVPYFAPAVSSAARPW